MRLDSELSDRPCHRPLPASILMDFQPQGGGVTHKELKMLANLVVESDGRIIEAVGARAMVGKQIYSLTPEMFRPIVANGIRQAQVSGQPAKCFGQMRIDGQWQLVLLEFDSLAGNQVQVIAAEARFIPIRVALDTLLLAQRCHAKSQGEPADFLVPFAHNARIAPAAFRRF